MFFNPFKKTLLLLLAAFLMTLPDALAVSYSQENAPSVEAAANTTENAVAEPELVPQHDVAQQVEKPSPEIPVAEPTVQPEPEKIEADNPQTPEPETPKPNVIIEKEQTVYVPYEKLKHAFETEGRGVFLPYAEFRKLWDLANQAKMPEIKPEPVESPIKAMITESESVARVNGDLIEVTSVIRFDLLEPGWHQLPLQLQQSGIIEAQVNGQPAQILGDNQNGFILLVERKKDAPVRGELTLKYAKSYDKSPGRNSVAFQAPQAPMSRWEFRIPDTGIKVDFHPMIAASEFPAEDGSQETVFRAFAGSASHVQIGWTPKSEGATGLETLSNVQTQQSVLIEEGVMRNNFLLNYTVSRGQLEKLALEVPDDQKIIGVLDDNVRSWNITQGENVQVIQVELFEPAKAKQQLLVQLEQFVPVEDQFSVNVPRIKVIGVGGHQGILAVDVSPGLVCEQKKIKGMIQIDPRELPATLQFRNKGGIAYRLSAPAYELELALDKEQPRIFAKSQVYVRLNPKVADIRMMNVYRIENAGVFQFYYDIPAEMNVGSVTPHRVSSNENMQGNQQSATSGNYVDAVIDGWQFSDLPQEEGKPKLKRLTVNLARKAIGNIEIQLHLTQPLQEGNTHDNPEEAVDVKIVLPVVSAEGIEQKEGFLVVSSPEMLRVTPTQVAGMQNVSLGQLRQDRQISVTYGREDGFAYVFAAEQPELTMQVAQRSPQVTVKQVLSVRIDDGVARFNNKVNYNVLYNGIKSLRLDLPKEISNLARNQTNEFRDTIMSPQPEDVAEGCVAWNFERGSDLIGQGTITLSWEKQIPQLLDGTNVQIPVPRIVVHDVFRSWGQILLAKAETVDLSTTDDNHGLRQIDPQHDIEGNDRVADAAYAFEYHDQWELTLNATRYELHEVKRASIEHGLLRVVLTRANTQSVQALYRIQSVKQRLPIVLPENCTIDTEPRINGVPVNLETDATNQFLIPLTSTVPDKPFLLELRYTQKNPKSPAERKKMAMNEKILMPIFPDDPAVQHIYVAAYVPEEYALTAYQGNCSKNFQMYRGYHDKNHLTVINTPSIDQVMSNMRQGVSAPSANWGDFPLDGTPYLFSTVQPDSKNHQLLSLRIRKTSSINFVMFALIVAGGAVLTRFSWLVRGISVFGAIAVYALLAFVLPTMMYVAGTVPGTRWGIAFVIILWLIVWLLVGWNRIKQILTTPISGKKKESAKPDTDASQNAEVASDSEPQPENTEGGHHE